MLPEGGIQLLYSLSLNIIFVQMKHIYFLKTCIYIFLLLSIWTVISHVKLCLILVHDSLPKRSELSLRIFDILLEAVELSHLLVHLQEQSQHALLVLLGCDHAITGLVSESLTLCCRLIDDHGVGLEAGALEPTELRASSMYIYHK